MDTPERLLRLLALFSARARWGAEELAGRMEVTTRTLRRDVTRLRALGYPIDSSTGRYGGYELGSGGQLPPLLLDDDEAIAVAVALRELSAGTDPGLAEAALSASTKLRQVLPAPLRERMVALDEVTVGVTRSRGGPRVGGSSLIVAAMACRRGERLHFAYIDASERVTDRRVEPHRLVSLAGRWYLAAFDLDRVDWRTFRVDRISEAVPTGHRNAIREPPDAAAMVAEGVAVSGHDLQARVRLHMRREVVAAEISPSVAVLDPPDADDSTVIRLGGEAEWIARYLCGLPCAFEVIEPDEVRREVRALARRLLRQHPV